MIKAFFRLWIFVFLPLLFLILPNKYSPISIVNDSMLKERHVAAFQGAFYLLEQRLSEFPRSQWPDEFPRLVSAFQYEIKLLPLNASSDDSHIVRQLTNNEYAYIDNTSTRILFKRIADSGWVISMFMEESEHQDIVNSAQGIFSLLVQNLQQVDQGLWPTRLAELESHFGFPLSLVDSATLSLSTDKMATLDAEGVAWLFDENDRTLFYYRFADSRKILRAGPTPLPGPASPLYIVLLIVLVGGISLGMLLFVLPLWRDLNKLADSASKFGEGYLDSRAEIGRHSVISRLGISFNAMADRIETLIKGHRDLTNAIAHDLRTPLSRISFAFEMLDSSEISDEDRKRYGKSIASGVDALDYLIRQILTLSRYSRAADITHFEHCKLAALLIEEIEQHQAESSSPTIALLVDPQLEDQDFFVDQRAMLRALTNLVSNAVRYARSRVIVSLSVSENNYQLTVEDDGPGIPEIERDKVFIPFTQLENHQREISNEHGLGLAIVQQIALWHKGSVTLLDSSLGGARFDIVWPMNRR